MEKKQIFIVFIIAVIVIILVGVIMNKENNNNESNNEINNELLQIPNPISEVNSVEEMEQYLGFIPKVLNKEISVYQVIDNDEKPIGEIIYKDESRYRMSRLSGDISGIYGGEKEKTINTNNIDVTIYTMEDTRYAIWKDAEYSYSYSSLISNENFETELNELIQ